MDKMKVSIIAVTLLVLFVAGFFVVRFVSSALFAATEAIKTMGEAPLPTETIEEKWEAPEMSINVSEYEAGIDSVEQEYQPDNDQSHASTDDEDIQSVPIVQTADELAGTSPEELPDEPE